MSTSVRHSTAGAVNCATGLRPEPVSESGAQPRTRLESTAPGGLENLSAKSGFEGGRKGGGIDVTTEAHRLPQGGDKFLAVGTGAQMFSDFLADTDGQFVVQIGGETAKHFYASGFRVPVMGM